MSYPASACSGSGPVFAEAEVPQVRVPLRLSLPLIGAMILSASCESPRSASYAGQRESREVALDSGYLVLEQIASIGVLEGPPEYAFGRVEAVVRADAEHFFACDVAETQLRNYTLAGVFVKNVGRKGSGPGEYESCHALLTDRAGNIVINDVGNGRLVLFGADGGYKRSEPWPPSGTVAAFDTVGNVWSTEYRAGRGGDERSWNMVVVRDREGQRLDSLIAPSLRLAPGDVFPSFGTDEGTLSPQTGDSIWSVLPRGGLAIARTDEYAVQVRTSDGSLLSLTRAVTPIEYSPEERKEWEAAISRIRSAKPFSLPDAKPIIRQLRGDDSGRLWVRLADSAYRVGESAALLTHREQGRWDVWDIAARRYLGEIRLPRARKIVAISGSLVWLSGPGPNDEQKLEIHRLSNTREP